MRWNEQQSPTLVLELVAPESGDGFESNDAETGVAENLTVAMADLEADTALCEAVGSLLTANHIFW